MDVDAHREARSRSFDDAVEEYEATRPGYPAEVFDEIAARVAPPADVLEFGPGTGQATGALLERGYRVLAIEQGPRLAARLVSKFSGPGLTRHVGRLEDWPIRTAAFDLAAAFSAFHWLQPGEGYRILATALRPGGWLAHAWNEPSNPQPLRNTFEADVQPIYRRCAPMLALDAPHGPAGRPGEDHDRRGEIAASGYFEQRVERLSFPWSRRLDTATYLRLLDTYSGHRQLATDQRQCLHDGIARLLDERFGGEYLEERNAILYLARRPA